MNFCINDKELCIKNEEFCIQNDDFCSGEHGPGSEYVMTEAMVDEKTRDMLASVDMSKFVL